MYSTTGSGIAWDHAAGADTTDLAVAVLQYLCYTKQQLNGCDAATSLLLATAVKKV